MSAKSSFWKPLASLKFTVVLFALSMILILVGTFAQIDYGLWLVLDKYFRCFLTWIGPIPFPGGFTLGGLMIVNLTAAFVTRFRLNKRGAGLWIMHSGLILLLVGEVVTACFAVEGNMHINEGGYANYVEHQQKVELAIVDHSGKAKDHHVVIPGSMLSDADGPISHQHLPFTLTVEQWMPNSNVMQLGEAGEDFENPANRGFGQQWMASNRKPVTGVGNGRDIPSAYISLEADGEKLGTYLISLLMNASQPVKIGEATYDLSLRSERNYKSYTLFLKDFKYDKFTGTEMARNFSSLVQLVDPEQGEDREVLIYMNHPLRYAGETFYQSSFKPDESGTVLQVVNNPGWLLPYISCSIMTIGLLWHFLLLLGRFLKRREKEQAKDKTTAPSLTTAQKLVTALLLLLVGASIARSFRPARLEGDYNLETFARFPVSSDGRVKPLDTIARNTLLVLSHKQELEVEGEKTPAIEWLLSLITNRAHSDTLPVFRIDDPDILSMLGLQAGDGPRFAFEQILPREEELQKQYNLARKVNSNERDSYQRAVLKLFQNVINYNRLASLQTPYIVPPETSDDEWDQIRDTSPTVIRDHWAAMLAAYRKVDPAAFNEAVSKYQSYLDSSTTSPVEKTSFEVFFNRAEPFIGAIALYIFGFLLYLVALLLRATGKGGWSLSLSRAALWTIILTLLLHTFGLIARVYITDRPPVTNLYSSAIFIGWGAVVFAIILEWIFRIHLAGLVASVIGFVTLIIAHNLSLDGDTMGMMQAVLDSNFWLTTHVIAITVGYVGTFLAGLLACFYVVFGMATRIMTKELRHSFMQMTYAVVAFSLLFSFVGTILGGIWADQSWGRFWGWDPKENGALLIVLWCAIILHARMSGWARERGFMLLTIFGNAVTAFSWFGTNMLGVGLHSYGFMESAAWWLAAFMLSQVFLILIGMIPTRFWRSLRPHPTTD